MINSRHEKPSKGNPYQLTIKQHVFPKRMIERFCNPTSKLVDVIRKKEPCRLSLAPQAEIFCAMRQWDQRAETLIGESIENKFNDLVDEIIKNPFFTINEEDNKTINSFYSLVSARQDCKYKPHNDVKSGSKQKIGEYLDKDLQERLESQYTYFYRDTGLPSRMFNGLMIQKSIARFQILYENLKWHIAYLSYGEIVVPEMIDFFFIPITPNIFLTPQKGSNILRWTDCLALNYCINILCQRSTYFFSRNLNTCFGFNLSNPWAFHPYHLPISKPLKA
ncbi:hypothetical protein [Komagataeibacter europaeus]|uniref:hypothetical protein n=1 Tax=Komagataeibacter europaeus TaxID=33995 RepID=UPI001EE24B3B|nr:hypothetical protein [Komagataeibacter europaeus]